MIWRSEFRFLPARRAYLFDQLQTFDFPRTVVAGQRTGRWHLVFREHGGAREVTHGAGVQEPAVEHESRFQRQRLVAALHGLELFAQVVAVVRVGAVVDDAPRALGRRKAAQVGYALFGGDDLHRMLAVVLVAYQRDDGADHAFLGRGRTDENRQEGVAREVARTADAVHHVPSHDVCGIHVAEKVRFERRIDGDDAQPPNYFRAVGYLLRPQDDTRAEEVRIAVEQVLHWSAQCQRGGRDELDAVLHHQMQYGVLQDLGVHLEGRDIVMPADGPHHGIGDVADARLYGEEALGNPAIIDFPRQEFGDVHADPLRHRSRRD